MNVQIIIKEGQPEYAVVPYEIYVQLVEDAELLEDIRDYDAAMKSIDEGEELVPAEIVYAILDGENPVRVWRVHRGLSQTSLAEQAGISAAYLSQIESDKRDGTADVLSKLAVILDVSLDDLVIRQND